MNGRNHLRAPLFATACLLLLLPASAGAEITGFQLNSITAVGSGCTLDERLGLTSGSTEHVINIRDCNDYLASACTVQIMWSLTGSLPANTTWMVKMSKPGGTCNDTDFTTLGGTCLETPKVDEKDLTTSTNNTFTVPISEIVGGNCTTSLEQATKLYVMLKQDTVVTGQTINAHVISINVDLKAPQPPTLGEVKEGDSNLRVNWKDDQNSDTTGLKYRVYWNDSKFTQDTPRDTLESSAAVTGDSYQIEGLTNDTEYFFAVAAVDENDNESGLSAVSSGMPIQVYDFYEMYKQAGGRDQGSWCFVATAAWGSPMEPEVQALRDFRDRYLMSWGPGRALVHAYYAASPRLADAIARNEALRSATRAVLWPVVVAARAAGGLPAGWGWVVPAGLLLALGAAVAAGVRVARGRRAP